MQISVVMITMIILVASVILGTGVVIYGTSLFQQPELNPKPQKTEEYNTTNLCTYWSSVVEINAKKADYDKGAKGMAELAIPIANDVCDPTFQDKHPFQYLYGDSFDHLHPEDNIDKNYTRFLMHHGMLIQTKCCSYMLSTDDKKTWIDMIYSNGTEHLKTGLNSTTFDSTYKELIGMMK